MAATLLFSSPFTAQAAITDKDGKALTPTNKVYNIKVQEKYSNVGVNKFKDFSLDSGHIANIQFGKLQTVANLVENKISINGTVNALRDGKIGGNLYFLSPNGIAVGATGVINAGAFTGIAVDSSYFNDLCTKNSASSIMTALAPNSIVYNNDPSKGIDIQGVINAPGGIHLYATKIDVGKDAILRTNMDKVGDLEAVDFTKVVNITDKKGTVLVDSGITGGLDASYKDGDIVLTAHAEHIADDNTVTNLEKLFKGYSGGGSGGTSTTLWEKETTREATINVDGKIKSAGDVSINADSEIKFTEGSKFNAISQTGIADAFLGVLGIDCAAEFAKKDNSATVNIGKTADIHSLGNMDISSTANLTVSITAKTPAVKSGTTSKTDWLPATSIAVISATNKATVNIDGKLKSEGTMAINAKAETSLSATAETSTVVGKSDAEKGLKEDSVYIAIGIIDGETKAEVNINSGNKIEVGGKDYTENVDDKDVDMKAFEATATTKNEVSNSVTAATKATSEGSKSVGKNDDTAISAAINVTDYDSTANVNVNRSITAKNGGINLNATNTIENEMETDSVAGREIKPMKDWTEVPGPTFLNSLSSNFAKWTKNKISSLISSGSSSIPEGAGGSTLSKIFNGEYFRTGVTVGVFAQDNDAKVTVGNKATLNAKNDIDVSAANKIEGLSFSIGATVNNQTQNQSSPVMIGLGVLVSDIDNNSDVIVNDNLTSTDGNVSINTESGMNYDQFEAIGKGIVDAFEEIKKEITEDLPEDFLGTFKTYEGQVKEELDNLENTEDPAEYMEALDKLNESVNNTKSSGFDSALKTIDDAAKIKKDLESFPEKLTAYLHPSSYANYYALAAFYKGDEANEDTKLEAAGALSINSMLNNSRIVVGDNSVISAENGTVNANSLAQNSVVAITGMGGEHLTSAEAQNKGVGISVMVGNFKNNAVTTFGKNTQIKSKDIKLETNDYAKHVNLIYGNGKADSTSITGMVSYFNTPSNSILSLDDSTKLNASGEVNLKAISENYITSVDGGITLGNGNGKSFGAAINILNNDANTAVIVADNGVNSKLSDNIKKLKSEIETESEKDSPDQNILVDKKTELKTLKITKTAQDILGEDYTKLLGETSTKDKGEITANTFTTKSENTGTINAIAIEGTENSESHGLADQFNDKVYKGEVQLGYAEGALKWPGTKLSKMLGNKINDKFKSGQNNPADAANQAGNAAGNEDGGAGENAGVNNNIESQLNVAGAGSAAINIKSGETGSFISNSKITAKEIDVSANDDAFHGSWAGAGAFNFFGNSQAAKNTNVAIGGAVAYADNSKNVDSVIKNSEINATSIKNVATRDDSDVSAGMGLAVSTNKGDQGKNIDVAISASINFIEGDTHALLIGNTVKGVKDNKGNNISTIENKATIDSLQVAGGLDIAGSSSGGKGFNLGGSAAASKITNDLQSGIKGGSYENLSNVDITADKKSNQIDVAVAGGITTGSKAKGFSFGGAVAVSDINNNSRAFLNDTTKFSSSGIVKVDALDSKNENSRNEYLSSRSINTDPTSFLDSKDKSKVKGKDGGGNIVNVALGGGASTGEAGAGGLGISYAGISNVMNVDISNNQAITAKDLNANTTNKSNIVNVTLGLAGSNKSFSAAGSFGVSDMVNDGKINIKSSNVTADSFLSGADSSAHIVNVAGQAALADEFAGGLAFAYNAMNNTTGINVEKGTWNVKDFGANAENDNYALAIGAGVAFSKEKGALNGAIGLNLGNNSTKSIVDGLTMNGIKVDDKTTQSVLEKLKVTATDKTSKTTVAGGLTITKGGKVAAGGAVAYADIGTSDNKEVINAKVTNSNINAKSNSEIDVEALDKATMTTVAVGVGGATSGAKVTFQGAAAVSELNKENVAEISNSNITGDGADIKIKAISGGNSSEGLEIGGKKIDVNNKVNTAAAALDVNLSDNSLLDGALAISVNNFNQSTEANFKNNSKSSILSHAGNVNMFTNSEADVLGVALGGAGGKSKVSAAGSVSYNYIDNSAKTNVENVNVKADKNFGVVAQSDDKMANYAGAVDIDVDGYGSIGVSVAYNEIKGNTDADIKNSNIEVGNSTVEKDLIEISNPEGSLINDYVTKDTWTSGGLFKDRKKAKKSGLVVNSSATHSISSDLATIGIRANAKKPGVGASGTVNINKISGATNAKVENTDVTADKTNAFVNASDYTNNGSFIGNAAISGTIAAGVLWNENVIDRQTNAFVGGISDSYKPTLKVKNLDVKADSRQGLSNLNIAVGAAFTADKSQAFAAASGDNIVRNQLKGTTTAKIENAKVNHSEKVNVDAYHKDNAFATNIAVGAAIDTSGSGGATFDLGYGLMRENSTVNAEINNSTLTSESGAVNVNAENDSKIAGAFGTMGVAVHAGESPGFSASVALGINNNYITNNVHAGIKGSTLNVGAVDVNAKNTSTIKADGGVASIALNFNPESFFASLGAAVAVTNATFDNKVTADVDSSTINASGDVNINARDDHKSDETVVSAAISTGVSAAVNRMSTSVNSGLSNLTKDDLGQTFTAKDLTMKTDNASKENADSDSDKLIREYGDEHFLNTGAIDNLLSGVHTNSKETKDNIKNTVKASYTATVNYNNSLKNGVFANVANESTIDAGDNKISIGSTENNDLSITSGSGSAGVIAGIGVGSTSIKARRANTANVIGSELKAKNIDIFTTNGQTGSNGIYSKMYNATLSPIGVSVGYNNVETNGTGEINIANAKITATENINATATDNSKSKSYILDAGIKQLGYTGVFAYNTNVSQTGIAVSNKSSLTAKNINFDSENHTHRATDTLAISVSGTLGIQTNTSEANDTSKNFIKVSGAGNSFTADNLKFNALNGSQTYAYNNGQAYVGLNAIIASGLANSKNQAEISVADANTFANKTINFNAQVGEDGKKTAMAEGFAINASTVGVNVDDMVAKTESTANISVGNEYFNSDTTFNLTALNKASRDSFMRNNAYAVVANANDISSYTIAKDKAEITVGSSSKLANANKLAVLNINSDTENISYVAAKGTGGAIGGDFGSAAHAENDVDNTSSATINGNWDISGDLTLSATQHDKSCVSAYSARGAILTGGKGSLDNKIKGTTTAEIGKEAEINAKTVNVNSKNYITTDKYSSDYDHTLYGLMIGVVEDIDHQTVNATTNKSANINIGDNATVATSGKQIYDALNDYNLKNDVLAEGGSVLASVRWVNSLNHVTTKENITVGTKATLKNEGGRYEDGGITMAAHDKLELDLATKGNSNSAAGAYVRAKTLLDLTRTPTININGTLNSAKDLNLYAGADINGESAKVHSYAKAISQVRTLVDDGGADVIREGKSNSGVNINSGALGQAMHDVNIISNAGWEIYEERPFYGSAWKSEGSYKIATSTQGDLTTSKYKHDNKVKVDGELKAANTPNATINISGIAVPDNFLLVDKNAKYLSYSVKSGNETVTEKNTNFKGMNSAKAFAQQIFNGITTSTVDPEESLVPRYKEVCESIANYHVEGREDIVAYNGLLQERISLEEEMVNLGMGGYNEFGEFRLGSSSKTVGIKTLVLPDIEVSGGSINVNTDNFTGSGKLNASGVPVIDVKNDSTAYLVTNKLTIADKGGTVNYNGTNVTNNADIGSGANFAEIKVADSKAVPTIKVSNDYSGSGSFAIKLNPNVEGYNELPEDKTKTVSYDPLNYIEVNDDVSNPVGKVFINNSHGSIRISTGKNVNALDIEMTARESITQGYTEGIVNIAYDPKAGYSGEAAKLRKEVGWDASMPTSNDIKNGKSNWKYEGGTAWQAGNAIYISARDININGLVQGGYKGFDVTITQADIDNATETVFFNGATMYKVNEGGAKFNKNAGYYILEPQVYYDKTNNKLYVEDINATGGKVYLAGRISSTGNGRIVVSDGESNINITNTSSADMNIGKITSTIGEGFIQIADSEQDRLTEYSKGKTRTIENYSAWLNDNSKGKVTESNGLSVGQSVKYTPKSGLTYNWAEGTKQEKTTRYYFLEHRQVWGLMPDPNYTSDLKKLTETAEIIKRDYSEKFPDKVEITPEPTDSKPVAIGNGEYISNGTVMSDNLTLLAQNVMTGNSYGNHTVEGPRKSGWDFHHYYDHRWTKSTGSKQIYQYSLKADYPIEVGIIGENGKSTINLENTSNKGGDLYLTGTIRNDKGTLSITSQGGSIIQNEGIKISTDNINLAAQNDIKNIDVINHRTDDLKLHARSYSNEGEIDINVTGGMRDNKTLKGAVVVDRLSSKQGKVELKAQGDIKQENTDTTVNARNIKLESTNGAINLHIESDGQSDLELSAISAAAKGDIKLVKNDNNDFLIGSIVSTTGDVELKANGKFVDALDKVRDNSDTQKSELVKAWIDMGLIAGTDDYKGAYIHRLEKDRDNYKADVTAQFKEYKNLRDTYTEAVANYKALKKELDDSKPENFGDFETLNKKFGSYSTVADYLAADSGYKTAKDKDAYKAEVTEQFTTYKSLERYKELVDRTENSKPEETETLKLLSRKFSKYDSEDAYLAADKDYQTLVATVANPQYQWTEEELLSAIRSSIVNKQEGSDSEVTRRKDANITARNVTLTGTGVGTNSKEKTKITMSELRVKENETAKEKSARLEKLSLLSNVEAADVTVNYVLDENKQPVTQTVERVTYRYDAENGYYIDKAGNYVRYRNDVDGNLMKYSYDKDLKQIGDAAKVAKDAKGNYDFSDIIDDSKTKIIENKEIESFEISGKIPVGINATGNITIKATGKEGVYIAGRNKGVKITETNNPNNDVYSPLNINKIETTEIDNNYQDVRIVGAKGIFNTADSGENVIGKNLVLVGGNGSIGTQEKPFTVRLTGDLLDARANDEINLNSVGGNDFRVSAIYSPKAVRITTDKDSRIEHSAYYDEIDEAYINTPELTLNSKLGTSGLIIRPRETTVLNLKGGGKFYIKGIYDGTINLNDISGTVEISSEGSVKQTANGANSLTEITVAADGDVILDGKNNKLDAITIGKIGGNFELKNDSDKLTADFKEKLTGKVGITQRGDIDLTGAVSGSVLSLTSEKGNIISTGGLQAADEIKLSSATFTHKGEVHTNKLSIATDNGVKIDNTENSFSELEISSRDGKAINGSVEVTIKADKFAPTIKNDITGDVTLTNTKTGGLLSFGDGETINIGGNFNADSAGDFEYGSTLLAGKDIDIRAKQNIYRRAGTAGYFGTTGKITFNIDNTGNGNKIGTFENPIMIANSAAKTDGLTIYGETHIKGVNDGILTIGMVSTDKDVSISSEGSIVQADSNDVKKSIYANKLTIAAAKDIILDNTKNKVDTLVLNTLNDTKNTGDVKINVEYSSKKDLTVEGNFKTSGNIDIVSYNKPLTLNGDIESDKNINLTADYVKLAGKVATPNLEVTTNKGLEMNNDANVVKELTVKSNGEQINGSISATRNFEFPDEEPDNVNLDDYTFSARILNKVAGDLTLNSNGIVSLTGFNGDTFLKTLEVGGNVTLDTGIGFITGRPISAKKDINILSRYGGMFVINIDSADNPETLKANKNVNLSAADSIDIDGRISAGKNITAKSQTDGINIFDKAYLSAGKELELTVGEGDINVEGSVTSTKGNVNIKIDNGNLNITNKLKAKNGNIDATIGEGNIQIGEYTPDVETVIANGDINITTGYGTIKINGKTTSDSGSIKIEENSSQKNPDDSSNTMPSSFLAADVAENTTLDDEIYEPSDIKIAAELKANHSVSITTDDGDIDIFKSITVTNGDITIATSDGSIWIGDNGSKDMLSTQNDLNIQADKGAVTIEGKISTQDGDITITSSQDSYTSGQKGITVAETGEINPAGDTNLNVLNGDIEFKKISADNVDIKAINGDVKGDSIKADDTIHIELTHGDLYLNLAQSKGVAILANNTDKSSVKTIKSDSVNVDRKVVSVGKILPYKSVSPIKPNNSTSTSTARSSSGFINSFSNNFTSDRSSFATLGTTSTRNGSGVTYWQSATSTAAPSYSFDNFASVADDMGYRLGKNYFEIKFVPTWLEREFMSIDFDYSFENFGIKNATEDELTID